MWVDVAEVEIASEHEDDGSNRGDVAITARLAFSCLEQAIDGLWHFSHASNNSIHKPEKLSRI